jgi:mannonate dehydratase
LLIRSAVDFLRMHVSQMGGIIPARNAAIHGQIYGVRTAWHGPGDTSPVGHAANLHLDLWAPNFGVQEWCRFDSLVYDMFRLERQATCTPTQTRAGIDPTKS